jgi:hypothetical protein
MRLRAAGMTDEQIRGPPPDGQLALLDDALARHAAGPRSWFAVRMPRGRSRSARSRRRPAFAASAVRSRRTGQRRPTIVRR